MKDAARQTRSYLMKLFEDNGYHPRTDLGQNFLIDLNIVEYVVNQGEICSRDVILEVGAGTGGMTTFLAQRAARVISVELDRNMHELARISTADFSNVDLLRCDALHNKNRISDRVLECVEQALAESPDRQLKLVANLPYSIATPLISNLVATELPWVRMVVTIQLELGERIVARPSSSKYGSLSVWLQSQCKVKLLKRLPPNVFWPRPKVNSAVVLIRPNPRERGFIQDRTFFQDFVRRLFHHRRKLLRSVLVGMYRKQLDKPAIDELLSALRVDPRVRAEQLGVRTLVRIGNATLEAIHALQDRTADEPREEGPADCEPMQAESSQENIESGHQAPEE